MECMKINWHEMRGQIEVAPGIHIWKSAKTTLTGYKGYDVDAEVSMSDKGRLEVESLTVRRTTGGPPVTGEALRQITVQSIIRDSVKTSIQFSRGFGAGTEVSAWGMLDADDVLRLKKAGPTPETLEWVGRVYRVSELVNDPPTKAVEEVFQISRSTAGSWIGRARAAGHIPPTGETNA